MAVCALQQGGQLAVECLPDTTREPAVPKVRKLAIETEFAAAQSVFQQQAASSAVATTATADAIQVGADVPPGRKSA